MSFTLRLQRGDKFDEFRISERHFLEDSTKLRWTSEWPYEDFKITNQKSLSVMGAGVVGLMHAYVRRWPTDAMKHNVVYVGQAFGQAGERTAWDRLRKHETA
jgi:hypothetical protein